MLELELFVIFVTSLALTFSLIPLIMRLASTYGLYDFPDSHSLVLGTPRRIHAKPIPRLGGIAMVVGFFSSMLIWASPLPLRPIFGGSVLMFCMGVVDDIKPLSAKLRLLLQCLVAGITVFMSNLGLETVALSANLALDIPSWMGQVMAIFILIGSINAINLADGLDGLAGGVVLISIVLLSLLHFLASGDVGLLIFLTVPLTGCLLGFLRYNTHPASIFMGDGGSTWLGYLMGAYLLLVLNNAHLAAEGHVLQLRKLDTPIPFISVVMCLAVPITDTAVVIIRRLAAGKRIMSADRSHFHHTLLKIGLSHSESVLTIYFLALVSGISGLMPIAYPSYKLEWVPYLSAVFIGLLIIFSLQINEVLYSKIVKIRDLIFRERRSNRFVRLAVRYLYTFNRYLIYGILMVAPVLAGVPPKSLGYAAIAGIVMLFASLFKMDLANFFQSFVISLAATILLTAINFNTLSVSFMNKTYEIHSFYNYGFFLLLIGTIFYFFLTAKAKSLLMTPTDFLMLGLPLLLLLVPEPFKTEFRLNIISLRALVLFVAIRVLSKNKSGTLRRIRLVCFSGLVYVSLAALYHLKIIY